MCTEKRFDEGIRIAGGLKTLADLLGENPQTVANWRARGRVARGRGIPPNKCKAFSAATGIPLRELRPRDWADYWPELETVEV